VTADGAQGDAPAADAALEAEAEAGPVCVTDLSGVGTGDFHVSFDMETDAQTFMALVNQRSACSAGVEWDVFMQPTGSIEVETDDGIAADRVFQIGGGPVNDGQPHHVEAAERDHDV
jgi:hypothetical protein